jgi:phage terminase large subunit GpA-like protein
MDAAAIYGTAFSQGLRPESRLTVSEWADKYRLLSQRASAEAGRWRTTRTPYLREIMDSLSSSSPYERVVFMKGAQIGGTECGNNWLGYIIHHAPGPVMSIQPTVEMAKRNSKQRIDPLIEESPVLRDLVQSPRSRDSGNTILSKEFPGGVLVMTGANSAVGLRSMAARYLFLDEVDAYPLDVDGEGDPIVLAMARARTFARRKIFLCSTPLSSGSSRIEAAYEESDKRRYFVPCPFCNHFQVLEFGRIRWESKDPETAAYFCVACEGRIENHQKTVMLERGEWGGTAGGDGKTAGFHLPSYYSPVGWFSFVDAARMFISASTKGAQQLLRVFTNTVDASTWKELGEAPDWQRLYERAQAEALPYSRKVPQAGLFLTAGADVQKDRIEVQVVAWGRGKESWLIDYEVLAGDTSRPEVWAKLTEYAGRTFTHESGTELPITRFAIDSGAETQMVYSWVRSQDASRVLAVKGADHGVAIVGLPTSVDITASGKKARRAAKVWPVNVSALKSELYGWLKLDMPPVERRSVSSRLLPLSAIGRRVFSTTHGRAVDHQDCEGLPQERVAKGSGAQRGTGYPDLCPGCGLTVWNGSLHRATLDGSRKPNGNHC